MDKKLLSLALSTGMATDSKRSTEREDLVEEALNGEETVVLIDSSGDDGEIEEALERKRWFSKEFQYGLEPGNLDDIRFNLVDDLDDAKEEEQDYFVVLDPAKMYEEFEPKACFRFLYTLGKGFRKADSEVDSRFQVFYLTDSETYSEKEWAQLNAVVDAELDMDNYSFES